MIRWIGFISTIVILGGALVLGLKDLLDRPKYQHGPEVEDLDALFRSDLSDDTVPLTHPGKGYRGRYRRRG